jgi:hypothetical protein
LEDDNERYLDPDCVNPEDPAPVIYQPLLKIILKPSTSQAQSESPLKIIEPNKARSKNLIWTFFVTDDKPVNKSGVGICLEKGAQSKVPLEGAGNKLICNVRLKQGGAITSGLNSHL